MPRNNESVGIAAEVAIAEAFDIKINPEYAKRAENSIKELLLSNNSIKTIFEKENIPIPVSHLAEKQNPVDFLLADGQSLSVKSNQGKLGKVAPQNIGQPTSETYFSYLEKNIPGFSLTDYLNKHNLPDTYEGRSAAFKKLSIEEINNLIKLYWNNLFECDYYLHFYNLKSFADPLENYLSLRKSNSPEWIKDKFTFTQTLNNWNESNTLKYYKTSIGEFQVHRNRNCFKFRFNMNGITRLRKLGFI